MALYDFRMEDPDSGQFREGTIQIEDYDMEVAGTNDPKVAAKFFLETREQKLADFRLSTDELRDLANQVHPSDESARDELMEKLLNEGINMDGFYDLPGIVRGTVAVHHQEKPYAVVQLQKQKGS